MRVALVLAALVAVSNAQRWWPVGSETMPSTSTVIAGTCPAASPVMCMSTLGNGCCAAGSICGDGMNKCAKGMCCPAGGAVCNPTATCVGSDNNEACKKQVVCSFGSICCSEGSSCKTYPDGSIGCASACFSGDSMVQTPNGNVMISTLKIGDQVMALNRKTNTFEFSPVYAFLDVDRTSQTEFLEMTTAVGVISLTAEHLIFASSSETGMMAPIPAKKIVAGDYIQTQDGQVHVVTAVSTVVKVGAFAPATIDGTIVVNNFVASCYAYTSHSKAHAALAPLRWLWASTPQVLIEETPADGMHWFANFLHKRFVGLLDV